MGEYKGVVLIVDDIPTNVGVLMEFLESSGYKVLVATDGESAIEQAEYAHPDIILLDVMMPGIDGFETCQRLKANETTHDIPVVFMTALSETVDKVRGFELGAADYITKPLQQEEVVARVNAHLTLYRQKQEIERLRQQDQIYYENLSLLKDKILNTASHDLKNPLTAILFAIDLARRYISTNDPRVIDKLNQIELETNYMRSLITNLLDLAQLETGIGTHIEAVSLRALLETNIDLALILAEKKHIALSRHLPARDVTFHCDSFQMGQVLQNLMSNAVKYTPEGGSIEVGGEAKESQVMIEVRDSGLGIPEADIPHLFEKFYRVNTQEHHAIPGTGLGLAIVQEIVQQHGGGIQVRSQLGVGSTFSVMLPL
ncbi:MAG: hybrid sensor histidine kinase/response regulator [Chloroflexota bacterium]